MQTRSENGYILSNSKASHALSISFLLFFFPPSQENVSGEKERENLWLMFWQATSLRHIEATLMILLNDSVHADKKEQGIRASLYWLMQSL